MVEPFGLAEEMVPSARIALTEALFERRRTTADPREIDDCDDRIVRINMPVARSIARRFEDRGLASEDLAQVAYLGLIKAVHGFDADRGDFLGFAVPTIRGEVRRWFRDAGWVVRPPRSIQELQPRINRAWEALAHELGRPPRSGEIAAELDAEESEVRRALAVHGCFRPSSLEAPEEHHEEETPGLLAILGAVDPGYDDAEARVALRPVLAALEPRERLLLDLWLFQGATQAEIGRRIGVTQTQVSRRIGALLRRMRRELEGVGSSVA